MTREGTAKHRTVFDALMNGADVQYFFNGEWHDVGYEGPHFHYTQAFRIKPAAEIERLRGELKPKCDECAHSRGRHCTLQAGNHCIHQAEDMFSPREAKAQERGETVFNCPPLCEKCGRVHPIDESCK